MTSDSGLKWHMGYVGVSRNDWYIPQIAMLIHFHREADDSEMDGLFSPQDFQRNSCSPRKSKMPLAMWTDAWLGRGITLKRVHLMKVERVW